MIYLNLPNLQDFTKEVISQKIKEVRLHSFYRSEPAQNVGSITSFYITLTALNKDQVIKLEEFIGRDITAFEDKMKDLASVSLKRSQEITKALERSKLIVKAGIYKFPNEV